MRRLICIWTRSDEGASAVEFALVVVLLVFLLMGIAQFGITFSQWLEIEHAAREGARWGSLGYAPGTFTNANTIRGKVYAASPGLSPRLTDAQIGVDRDPSVAANQGLPVTVTVTYATPILPLMEPILGRGPTLALTARAVHLIE